MRWDRDKERKAGRAMGIGSSIFAIAFMVVWCGIAAAGGAWIMLLFGLPMLGFIIYRLVIIVQKTKDTGEAEPWEQPDRPQGTCETTSSAHRNGFCPYCGRALDVDYNFCPTCGRRL